PCVRALANHREKGERREDEERKPPTFDPILKSNDQERAKRDADQNAAEEMSPRPDDAAERERNADARREGGETSDLLRSMPKHRVTERRGNAQTVLPARAESPDAQSEVADVVREKKHPNHDECACAQSKDSKRRE